MKTKVFLKEFDNNSDREKLDKWKDDKGVFSNSVDNYITFGLLDIYSDILNVIDIYRIPLNTEKEKVKIFVGFNEEGKDVGVAILDHYTDHSVLEKTMSVFHLIVRPDEQGKGYGSEIMRQVVENCEEIFNDNVDEIFTSVDLKNNPSSSVMKKLGLKIVHETENYNVFSLRRKEKENEKE